MAQTNQELLDWLTRLLACAPKNLVTEMEKLRVGAMTCHVSPVVGKGIP